MSSFILPDSCLPLGEVSAAGNTVAEITARAMNGELEFEEALRARVALMQGLDEAVIGRVLASRITLAPGAGVLVATMRANGAHAALISGGFTQFTAAVAGRLGFDENRANTLLTEAGRLTGDVAQPDPGARGQGRRHWRDRGPAGDHAGRCDRRGRRGQRSGHAGTGGHRRGAARQARGAGAVRPADQPRRPDGAAVPAGL